MTKIMNDGSRSDLIEAALKLLEYMDDQGRARDVDLLPLRDALLAPARQRIVPLPTSEYLLRAMAQNYGDGPHLWDFLDKEACIRAADEIRALRKALSC